MNSIATSLRIETNPEGAVGRKIAFQARSFSPYSATSVHSSLLESRISNGLANNFEVTLLTPIRYERRGKWKSDRPSPTRY